VDEEVGVIIPVVTLAEGGTVIVEKVVDVGVGLTVVATSHLI